MQPDASCEAETSFLLCFAFDDYELTCSTTSRPCSFPFDSLRAFASCARQQRPSLSVRFLLSLFCLISPPIALHFSPLYYLDVFLIFFSLIYIVSSVLHHANIKLISPLLLPFSFAYFGHVISWLSPFLLSYLVKFFNFHKKMREINMVDYQNLCISIKM